jgi:hypothetical protein
MSLIDHTQDDWNALGGEHTYIQYTKSIESGDDGLSFEIDAAADTQASKPES